MAKPDFAVHGGGSVYLLEPISEAAADWAEENLPANVMCLGRNIAVEWRFLDNIIAGIQADGLVVA